MKAKIRNNIRKVRVNKKKVKCEKIHIIKRHGGLTKFDKSKIEIAILKAMTKGSGIIRKDIAKKISKEIEEQAFDRMTISDIENLVYSLLIEHKQELTAKAYEGYRAIREYQRIENTIDNSMKKLIDGDNEYWNRENANKNATLNTTMRDYMAGIVSTDMTRRFLLTPDIVQAHDDGILHFHDADYFAQPMHNCCLINLEDMLQNGTMINNILIEKPKRFITAMTIATQIITAVTSSQYGGTSISLTHLAPFIRDSYNRYVIKYLEYGLDEKQARELADIDIKKEIRDGVQTFNYQLNSMTNTNGQSPFITVFMYLGETDEYKNELAMLIEEFLLQRLQGLKNEKGVYITIAFPKLIYVLEESNIHENSRYYYLTKLAARCTAKRLVPDYISEKKMKELKEGNCFPKMGCRSSLAPWKDKDGNYKFYSRFNQGVVTLNLVDLALSSCKDLDKFWELFEERTELVHKALQIRHNRLKGTSTQVAPILWQHGAIARLGKDDVIDELLYGGYSSISLGYAGLYECVKYMTDESIINNNGKEFGLLIMKKLNEKCDKWKAEENIGYSVYGTPIESVTYKFATKIKERFGVIEGVSDKDYITNSYHVHVTEEIDPFEKLELESEFQALSLGGAISYIETSNLTNNIETVLTVMKFMYDHIMYAELNTKSDYCQVCEYDGEILIDNNMEWYCPQCGNTDKNKLNVARRTCGYIGSNFFNHGRTQEIKERYVHLDNHDLGEI